MAKNVTNNKYSCDNNLYKFTLTLSFVRSSPRAIALFLAAFPPLLPDGAPGLPGCDEPGRGRSSLFFGVFSTFPSTEVPSEFVNLDK